MCHLILKQYSFHKVNSHWKGFQFPYSVDQFYVIYILAYETQLCRMERSKGICKLSLIWSLCFCLIPNNLYIPKICKTIGLVYIPWPGMWNWHNIYLLFKLCLELFVSSGVKISLWRDMFWRKKQLLFIDSELYWCAIGNFPSLVPRGFDCGSECSWMKSCSFLKFHVYTCGLIYRRDMYFTYNDVVLIYSCENKSKLHQKTSIQLQRGFWGSRLLPFSWKR